LASYPTIYHIAAIVRIFILTRGYPAQDRLYNHPFVHRRVLAYRAAGHDVAVFWLKHKGDATSYQFDGVDVVIGGPDACLVAIQAFAPDTIAAHAMADDFWPVLSQLPAKLPVNAWIYGAEILPFFAVTEKAAHDPARAEKARLVHERRIMFWRKLVQDWPAQLRLVFVSSYAANAARQALGANIPRKLIQPTGVDTRLFPYLPKSPEQRFNILSIRPFSDWRYANDLSVKAVLLLRDHPLFARLSFHFVGDGRLFDETVAPIRDLPNIRCEQRFLSQAEVARLHRDNGIFLCPSRDDAQGVSRDEAMSSGLVPIASQAGAVPEFVDQDSGLLVPGEDPAALAAAIAMLAEHPGKFTALSHGAAERIRTTLAMPQVIARELEILQQGNSLP
jgi:glycosyltransferase involved in cell wall biosynthesis